MHRLKMIFRKQGGFKLIKNYLFNGTFFTAVFQFLFLGRSDTALEILRLSVQHKIKQKLNRKYKKKLLEFDQNYDECKINFSSNKVWICWFQGIENAPKIVRKCYESIKKNMKNKDVILITYENIYDYVTFPEYILEKWKKGIITNTHMTDLLRLELLKKYGGLWLDATVFCTGNNIPKYIFDSDLFFYQKLKPGKNGNSIYISSWLISAKPNNKIICATLYLCYEYWKKNNSMIDYFLLHYFFSIVLDYYKEDWLNVIPVSNSTPHILLLRLFDKYDENIWNSLKEQTCFHKLTYKFDQNQKNIENTYYDKIINNN